jgi:hypothetical protein
LSIAESIALWLRASNFLPCSRPGVRRVEYPWARTAAKLAALPIDDEEKRGLIERLENGV